MFAQVMTSERRARHKGALVLHLSAYVLIKCLVTSSPLWFSETLWTPAPFCVASALGHFWAVKCYVTWRHIRNYFSANCAEVCKICLQATVGRSRGFDPNGLASGGSLGTPDSSVEAPLHARGALDPSSPSNLSGPSQTALPQGGHLLVSCASRFLVPQPCVLRQSCSKFAAKLPWEHVLIFLTECMYFGWKLWGIFRAFVGIFGM